MQSTTTLELNLQYPNHATTMHAVQNDRLSRKISAVLVDGATAWTPPVGTEAIIRYVKPDGTKGFYDVDENDDPAVVWTGNVATITLAEQVLTVAGDVWCQLNFYTGSEERLTTFKWKIVVQENVVDDETIISTDYFNILTQQIAVIEAALADVPSPSTDDPLMDGTASPGSASGFARGDHVHPTDTSRVPTTRKVNDKALSADITLSAGDVGAVPTTRKVNNKALSSDITLDASDVSAVPTTRKVNNKALSSDITLDASDVNAVPTSRTVNGKTLTSNVTINASEIPNDSDVSGTNIDDALNNLKESASVKPSVSMFCRFCVIGDSYASGQIYGDGDGLSYFRISWAQIIARKNGIKACNYAYPGFSTADFINSSHAQYNNYGMGKLKADYSAGIISGLYLICLGINDANNDPSAANVGSSSDINLSDYTQNANTFWGRYGRIIQEIQDTDSHAKIIACTFAKNIPSGQETAYTALNTAIINIATFFSIPYIDIREDDFFKSDFFLDNMINGHPVPSTYSAYAVAMERLVNGTIESYHTYFNNYFGLYSSVAVDKYPIIVHTPASASENWDGTILEKNGVIWVRVVIKGTIAGTGGFVTLATLPSGIRPSLVNMPFTPVQAYTDSQNESRVASARVTTDGEIQVFVPNGKTISVCSGSMSFPKKGGEYSGY